MKLYRDERLYLHMPFWGLNGTTPQYRVGEAAWANLTAAAGYEPPDDWTPPPGVTGDPEWFQVLVAGPEATSNPDGTVVITEHSRVFCRVVAGDEVDILPAEWILLTGAAA